MDWAFHFLIPLFILYFVGVRHKYLPFLALLTLVPDLEKPLGFGRVLFHNVFFVLLATILIYAILSIKKVSEKVKLTLISGFFLLSHLILDAGGAQKLLFPIIDKFFQIELVIIYANRQIPQIVFNINSYDFLPVSQNPFILTTEGFLIIIMTILLFLFFRKKT